MSLGFPPHDNNYFDCTRKTMEGCCLARFFSRGESFRGAVRIPGSHKSITFFRVLFGFKLFFEDHRQVAYTTFKFYNLGRLVTIYSYFISLFIGDCRRNQCAAKGENLGLASMVAFTHLTRLPFPFTC